MSIKLKDTIYDLVNKSIKDSSGNTITSTYLPLSGGTMTGTGYIIFSRTVGAGTTGIYIYQVLKQVECFLRLTK